jgi:hypothetical protein
MGGKVITTYRYRNMSMKLGILQVAVIITYRIKYSGVLAPALRHTGSNYIADIRKRKQLARSRRQSLLCERAHQVAEPVTKGRGSIKERKKKVKRQKEKEKWN